VHKHQTVTNVPQSHTDIHVESNHVATDKLTTQNGRMFTN